MPESSQASIMDKITRIYSEITWMIAMVDHAKTFLDEQDEIFHKVEITDKVRMRTMQKFAPTSSIQSKRRLKNCYEWDICGMFIILTSW